MGKYVLIPDKYKGTLSAQEICDIMRSAIMELEPEARIIDIPVADGGEGTVDAFIHAAGGKKVYIPVHGPYGERIDGFYGELQGAAAVVEMAAAAGLFMVGEKRNPEETSTFGVGELIEHALNSGAKEIVLGLGGSATNDGGCGMAAALGVRFFNKSGVNFIPVGRTLIDIDRIDRSMLHPLLGQCRFRVMCDIDNPLCGPEGAAAVFGPQKGADQAMVCRLDAGLMHMAEVVKRDLQKDILLLPGAGAAGGMGGGAVSYLDGNLQMGIDSILDVVHFQTIIKDADVIFTGEGRLDGQSLRGKVVIGVAREARKQRKPVIAIVGSIQDDIKCVYEEGVTAVFSINRSPLSYEQAILYSKQNLRATMLDVLRCWRRY